jgi:heme exporter protein CcmD
MMELLAMGEYGPYVWSSFLLTLVVVVIGTAQGRRRHNLVKETITRRLKIEESNE